MKITEKIRKLPKTSENSSSPAAVLVKTTTNKNQNFSNFSIFFKDYFRGFFDKCLFQS
jgi:hypothetical protein